MVNRPANEPELAATKEGIVQLERELGVALPSDYVAFMRQHNGGVWHGKGVGVIIWNLNQVGLENRAGTHFATFWPGLLVFASNGANEFFAFDTRRAGWPVIVFPGDVEDEDQVMPVAATFAGFFDARMHGCRSAIRQLPANGSPGTHDQEQPAECHSGFRTQEI